MSIKIVNDFNEKKIYSAFDNIIIEFKLSNEISGKVKLAKVFGLGIDIELSPSPNDVLYFNFKKYSTSYISENQLIDYINYFGETSKSDDEFLKSFYVRFEIHLEEDEIFTKYILLNFSRAVFDKDRFKNYLFVEPGHQIEYEAKQIYFFPGYPLEIGVFTKELETAFLQTEYTRNSSNSIQININELNFGNQFNRVVLSDGYYNLRSENGSDLMQNIKEIYINDVSDLDFTVKVYDIIKFKNCSGHYLKWLNRSGDYSYFLFSNYYEEDIDTDSLGSINNDYSNNDYSISRNISKGKESERSMTLFKKGVNRKMRYHLSDLIDSPRVYYYTGKKDSQSSKYDWTLVEITEKSLQINRPKEDIFNLYLGIKFENYKNQII